MNDESKVYILVATFIAFTISAMIMLYFIWHFSIFIFIIMLTISLIFGFIIGNSEIDFEVFFIAIIVLIIMTFSVFFYYIDEIFKDEKTVVKAVVTQTVRQKPLSASKETTQIQKIDLKSASIKARKNLQGYPCDNDLLAEYRKLMGNNDAKGELNQTVDVIVEKEKEKDKKNLQESKKIKSERNDVVKNNAEDKNNFEYDSNKSWVDNVKKYWSTPEFKSKVQFLNF